MSINFKNAPFETMLDNFSKTIVLTPNTKTISNISGNETLTESTSSNIAGAFYRKEDSYVQSNPGLIDNADAVILVKTSVTINKNDKITYDEEDYRVEKVITRKLGTISFYKLAQCFKI